jgi:hypothetical protein
MDSIEVSFKEGAWHHSTFPHPLITVDRNKDNEVIDVSAVGSAVFRVADAIAKGGTDEEILKRIEEITP